MPARKQRQESGDPGGKLTPSPELDRSEKTTPPWVSDPDTPGVGFHVAQWVGPLPPPSILAKYKEVIPDGAERILGMAERQAAHRIASEQFVIRSNVSRSWGGLIAGFVLSCLLILCGSLLIAYGHDAAGSLIIVGTIVSLAAVFVLGQYAAKKEAKAKKEAVQNATPPTTTEPSTKDE
jgi:uncharacterized membrane protein